MNRAWQNTLHDVEKWISSTLIKAMVHGGLGIQGIAETDFYRYISSPRGLSELGIHQEDPPKLLVAYETTAFTVDIKGDLLKFNFGDSAALQDATPHPYAGVGFLTITSWMDWVLENKTVERRGFVPRSKIVSKAQKYIRLPSPFGGLMLPRGAFGSTGSWSFPEALANYEDEWVRKNLGIIESLIQNQASVFMNRNLSRG